MKSFFRYRLAFTLAISIFTIAILLLDGSFNQLNQSSGFFITIAIVSVGLLYALSATVLNKVFPENTGNITTT